MDGGSVGVLGNRGRSRLVWEKAVSPDDEEVAMPKRRSGE